MKIQAFAVSLLLTLIALSMPFSAASYIDNMDNLNDDSVKKYSGFEAYSFSKAAAAVVPDATAVTFSGNRLISYADYRVNGATSVTASIYSQCGTFVCQDPNSPTQYMLGIFNENMDFLPPSLMQALYCSASGGVYTREGGLKQAYTDLNAFYFGDIIYPPAGELIGYGVNIYFSHDGISFVNAQAVHSELNYNIQYAYCLEHYTAQVPPSATYVRVEINDFLAVPLISGGSHPKAKKFQTALALVEISGDALVIGEPEPEKEIPMVSSSSSSPGYYLANNFSSSKAKSYSISRVPESEASSKKKEPSSAPSSKFEGTITVSSRSESSRSKRPDTSESRSISSKSSSAPIIEEEIPRDDTVVYEITKPGAKTGFDKGITAYIIVVSGAILTLAVLPKPK